MRELFFIVLRLAPHSHSDDWRLCTLGDGLSEPNILYLANDFSARKTFDSPTVFTNCKDAVNAIKRTRHYGKKENLKWPDGYRIIPVQMWPKK
jgi:hypothetical protein